jgi:hypothetical protein
MRDFVTGVVCDEALQREVYSDWNEPIRGPRAGRCGAIRETKAHFRLDVVNFGPQHAHPLHHLANLMLTPVSAFVSSIAWAHVKQTRSVLQSFHFILPHLDPGHYHFTTTGDSHGINFHPTTYRCIESRAAAGASTRQHGARRHSWSSSVPQTWTSFRVACMLRQRRSSRS